MQQTNRAYRMQSHPQKKRNNVVRLRDAKHARSGAAPSKKSANARTVRRKKQQGGMAQLWELYTGGFYTKSLDKTLLLLIIILVVFGLVMVFSASAPSASAYQSSPYYFIIRQAAFAVVGLGAMLLISYCDYHHLGKLAFPILVAAFLLLIAVYIPGLGYVRNNARRWINLGFTTLQPSEVVKIALVIFFAFSLSKVKDQLKDFWHGLMRYVVILGIFAGLVAIEPHLSATLIIGMTCVVLLFVAGAKITHFLIMGVPVVGIGLAYIASHPYQMERVTTFLNPFAYKNDEGFQVVNSLYAIGSGGIFGLGLGQSRQKYLYLPEPHNDFIFAIVCEELGLIGALLVLLLFGCLIWKGYRTAIEAPDRFGCLLATGITSLIAIQVLMNVAVVTSSIPATGVALPFFSYGGTSLLILLGAMGILLSISRQTVAKASDGIKL